MLYTDVLISYLLLVPLQINIHLDLLLRHLIPSYHTFPLLFVLNPVYIHISCKCSFFQHPTALLIHIFISIVLQLLSQIWSLQMCVPSRLGLFKQKLSHKFAVFWLVTPYSLLSDYHHFTGYAASLFLRCKISPPN